MAKGEFAHCEQFPLMPQCFQKSAKCGEMFTMFDVNSCVYQGISATALTHTRNHAMYRECIIVFVHVYRLFVSVIYAN